MNHVQFAMQFLLQIAVILLVCRIVGVLAAKLGQPQVVAEMVAGVLMGPSLLGLVLPDWQRSLFPDGTQSYLFPVAQLGLALYMFVVGMEFRLDIMRERLKCSMAVSAAGMIAPFVLGAGLGYVFFEHTELFPPQTSRMEAMLFLGASMCITAFPMLARIIQFKKLTGTAMGTVALGAGAIDDATAWCLLAIVLASFENDPGQAITNIGGGFVFVVVAIGVMRPLLKWMQTRLLVRDEALTEAGLVIGLVCMALGSWFTDSIGLHAVFGAFVMGAVMPRGIVTRDLVARIEPLTVALLVPLFFAYSGLNTQIGLLNSMRLWALSGLVLVAAVVGKGVACWWAARWTGLTNREALGIGTLMNARGMMGLIILNIGLQRGLITEGLFAILVIMAVVTTLMTSPIFDRLVGKTESVPSRDAGGAF